MSFVRKYFKSYNFYWKVIHVVALLFLSIFFAVKCFAGWIEIPHPVDVHGPSGEEILMEKKADEKQEQIDAVEEYYDQREENIEKWYEEDDYCDKDLRDKVLDKTKEERKEKIKGIKENEYTLG